MSKALVLLNFKTYKESIGKKALPLARQIAKAKRNGYEVVVAPSMLTLKEIAEKVKLPVFAQHCDHVPLGSHTGRIPAKELKSLGVKGVILNHSERKVPIKYLADIIESCRKNKLKTVVCASTLSEIKKVCVLHPDYVSYEPSALIGGNVSVTEAKPDVVVEAVNLVKQCSLKSKFLCGAGIHSKEDLGQALLLGADGVMIGHAVPKAKDPKKFLEGMLL